MSYKSIIKMLIMLLLKCQSWRFLDAAIAGVFLALTASQKLMS